MGGGVNATCARCGDWFETSEGVVAVAQHFGKELLCEDCNDRR